MSSQAIKSTDFQRLQSAEGDVVEIADRRCEAEEAARRGLGIFCLGHFCPGVSLAHGSRAV